MLSRGLENEMKLRFGLLVLVGLLMQGVVQAAQPDFKEGLQYTLIEPAPAIHKGDDIEVIEFFWYGCPHCNRLEPHIKSWLAHKADNVHFVRMPAPFSGRAELHAKTFYALQLLGEVDRLHDAIFHAIHEQHMKLDTLDEMVAFLTSKGVDEQKFRAALDSFAVQTQMSRTRVLARRYGIHSVPTLVVDGRYKSGKGFASYGEFTELVDYLTDKVASDRKLAANETQ
jgi:thiol:disulfide interchange protein DsbA